MKLFFTTLFSSFTFICSAQIPQAISYQAVDRNNLGELISNHLVAIRFSIHDSSTIGNIVYQEVHSTMTNEFGLFILNVGQGNSSLGNFSEIQWGSGNKFLQVELDTSGNGNFIDMGTEQMMSVPFSLYSNGFLPPRITATQRDAIINPVPSQIVYCTDCGANGGELEIFNGTSWMNMSGGPTASVLTVGQEFQGGTIGYLFQPGDSGYDPFIPHGLICASDYSLGKEWGCLGIEVPGADEISVGTGAQNTIDICNQSCSNYIGVAARYCNDLVYGSYNDWFLPSREELYKVSLSIPLSISSPYWTSTEYSDTEAWSIDSNGVLHHNGKSQINWVRPIRYF
ncbi:MAG: DUF1566 domain-containing protein [Bacteroidia bacterium]|nr:DUF1566 domain-containing protein [Bacteroidia bacterium]